MRAMAMVVFLMLAACSRERSGAREVDLNAAATAAQADIDNYAAARSHRPGRAVRSAASPRMIEASPHP